MPTKRYKHTDVFVLRVWYDENEREEGSGVRWHGRLQRPVTGEAHRVEDREALVEVLEAMLNKDQPQQRSRSPKNTSSEADVSGGKEKDIENTERT